MIRRSLSACLGAAALMGSLGLPAHADAEPPEKSESIYEALPSSIPTPTLYDVHPTVRRTVVGSLLFGIHPALALLPAEEALDAPQDHPRQVAGEDVAGKTPPQEAAKDGMSCPYLLQQRLDRHACQFADPQMGSSVLANLERLQQADQLMEMAEQLTAEGSLLEAMECCALAEGLCPGSPCADRAACMMADLSLVLRESASDTD